LVASTEYEDLANICDRVLVVRDGVITAELGRANLSEDRIVEQCYRTGAVAA
jgi:ribose transport system ATP-binding protein